MNSHQRRKNKRKIEALGLGKSTYKMWQPVNPLELRMKNMIEAQNRALKKWVEFELLSDKNKACIKNT